VRFRAVDLRYGSGPEILRGLSFHLMSGSFQFLTGPSGAGKTSLLKLMYLAHPPSGGAIELFDQVVKGLSRDQMAAMRRRIGVVFQDFRLIDHLSCIDNVSLPLRIVGEEGKSVNANARELLEWVGLDGKMNSKPATLSDGEKQRVSIARAVIGRPDLLIADEPTGNVDGDQGVRLMRLFEELNKIGTTVIIATHDEGMVARFSHPVLRLKEGCLTRIQ